MGLLGRIHPFAPRRTARVALAAWVSIAVLGGACADFEERDVASIPFSAGTSMCLPELSSALSALAPDAAPTACLYLPELECALEQPLSSLCDASGACALSAWSATGCTRGQEPVAELGRDATTEATLRVVVGEACPAHAAVYASGTARTCGGSALEAGGGCVTRLDFEMTVDADGALVPVDDTVAVTASALLAEELSRAGQALPCDAATELSEQAPVCVRLEGDGLGAVSVSPLPELGCARTSSASAFTDCPQGQVTTGRMLTLTASVGACSSFAGWSGACSGPDCVVEVQGEATCESNRAVARFDRAPVMLRVDVEGEGEVRVEPYASACADASGCDAICRFGQPCLLQPSCGEQPVLQATPGAGYALSSWGVDGCDFGQSSCPLGPLTATRRLTVRFARGEQTLSVDPAAVCDERITGPDQLSCGGSQSSTSDCQRRVSELSAVTLGLSTSQDARVRDWGLDCGTLASCTTSYTAASFEMPSQALELSPVVEYALEVDISGPGTVSGAGAPCTGPPGACPKVYERCAAQTGLTAAGVNLGACSSVPSGWVLDGTPICTGTPESCTLPAARSARELDVAFEVPVLTSVSGAGAVQVSTGVGAGRSCASGQCDAQSTAPIFAPGTTVSVAATGGSRVLCFEGCDQVDLSGDGRCTLAVAGNSCREPRATLGRQVSVQVSGPCQVTGPAPSPRSGGGRSCRDETALDLGSGNASRTYGQGALSLSIAGTGTYGQITSVSCSSGSCGGSSFPRSSLTLDIGGTTDETVSVQCGNYYPVEVRVTGPGAVSDAGGAIQSCRSNGGTCTDSYASGGFAQLSATPDSGAVFVEWQVITGAVSCTTSQSCNFSVGGRVELVARFQQQNAVTAVIDNTPGSSDGGSVISTTTGSPAVANEIDCPGTRCTVPRLQTHTVTMRAFPNAGFRFDGWSGDCDSYPTATSCITDTPDRDRTVTASFIRQQQLTLQVSGSGTVSGTGISCSSGTCTATYDYGTPVTLSANPPGGNTYAVAWTGDCAGTTGTTCTVTMGADRSVGVSFTLQTLAISVSVSGATAGLVTSDPAGISCSPGGGSCSDNFSLSQSVDLEASSVADYRYEWGGDCAGTSGDTCELDSGGSSTSVSRSATLTYIPLVELEVFASRPNGIRINSTPYGIDDCRRSGNGTCDAIFDGGTTVRLDVTGTSTTTTFSANCAPVSGAPDSCTITLPSTAGAYEAVQINP